MNSQEQKEILNNMAHMISAYLGNLVFWEIKLHCSIDDLTQEKMDEFISHARVTGQLEKIKHNVLVLNMSKHFINNCPKDVLGVISGLKYHNQRIEKLNHLMRDDFPKDELKAALEGH